MILKEEDNFVNRFSINVTTEDSWPTLRLGMKQDFL